MEVSESLPAPLPAVVTIKSNAPDVHVQQQVELVKCESCRFTEECTFDYISQIRQQYNGRWICGLCIEAVKYEILRSENVITTEEALDRHIDFYENFQSSFRDADHPISAEDYAKKLGFSERSPIGDDQSTARLIGKLIAWRRSCFSSPHVQET